MDLLVKSSESLKRIEDNFTSKTFETLSLFDLPAFRTELKMKEAKQRKSVQYENTFNIEPIKEEKEVLKHKLTQPKREEVKSDIYQGLQRGNTQDFLNTTPKSFIRHEEGRNSYSVSQGSSGNDSISSSKRGLILKHKLMQLNEKFRKQKILLVD